jgi:class 3 adenylate cyclase
VPLIPENRYASTPAGLQIAFQVLGDGPVDLVYLNGLTQHVDVQWDHPVMQRFLERLSSFSRLILFDRRDAFASDATPLELLPDPDEWAQNLCTVLDAVGSDRASIFAELEACSVPIVVAANHPDRVAALILANPVARYRASRDYPIGWDGSVIDEFLSWYETTWGTEELVRFAFPSLADDAEFVRWRAKWMRASASPRTAMAVFRHLLPDMDIRSLLPTIHARTLVLHRTDNTYVSADQARFVAQHIDGARFIEIPGSDAYLFTDRSDDVLDEVEEFLTGTRPSRPTERALATVMFTDIVGSTERAVALGDRRWRNLLVQHHLLVRRELDRFHGVEIDTAGDGFLARFSSPAEAIRCALQLSRTMEDLDLAIRAGVHTGEVELVGEGIGGIAVHIGARVAAQAGAGEVLVSRTVVDLVAGSGIEFEDRGEHELKGVPGMWRLFVAMR